MLIPSFTGILFSVFIYIVILHGLNFNQKMKKVFVLVVFMFVSITGVAQSDTDGSSTEITIEEQKEMEEVKKKVEKAEAKAKKEKKEAAEKKNIPLIVLDIPLLFEKGHEKSVDHVVVVSVAEETQRKRVLERQTMTSEMFEKILEIQMSDKEKRQKADFVIITDTLEQVKTKVYDIITKLKDI